MEIRVNIECDTISEFHAHLTELARQVKKTAKKQGLDPSKDEFTYEHEASLYDDNCYGTHSVSIEEDGATEEAQDLFLKFIDPIEHGENPDAERLWKLVFGDNITTKVN